MSGLFGGGDNGAAAMQAKQLQMQQESQDKLDRQERDRQAALLSRARAGASGGMRMLMSGASLGNSSATGGSSVPGATLGANG
jgi:hypothetical protein